MEKPVRIPKSLGEQVYQMMREDIISGKLPGGRKLTLKALQERYGVSVTPIREAVSLLAGEGLVEQLTNVGARVVDLSWEDAREIYELVYHLDNTALILAMERWSDALCSELRENIARQEHALASEDFPACVTALDAFHDTFYRHAGNTRLLTASRNIRGQMSVLAAKCRDLALDRVTALEEHKAILRAVEANDAPRAEQELRAHFQHTRSCLLDGLRQLKEFE